MKEWYLISYKSGDEFEERLNVTSRGEAEEKARLAWERLTSADKKRYTQFYACLASVDDNGCVDHDTEEQNIEFI